MALELNSRGIKRLAAVLFIPWAIYWSFKIYAAQSTLNKMDAGSDPFLVILLEDSRNHAAFMLVGFPLLMSLFLAILAVIFRWVRNGFDPTQS